MPYIVKSSLDIGGKIVPWNEKETRKLIKEKEIFLKENEKVVEIEEKDIKEINLVDEIPEGEEILDRVDIVESQEEVQEEVQEELKVEEDAQKKSNKKK